MTQEHRTRVSRGLSYTIQGKFLGEVHTAECLKSCGWVGQSFNRETLAERDGEDHESYMAMIES